MNLCGQYIAERLNKTTESAGPVFFLRFYMVEPGRTSEEAGGTVVLCAFYIDESSGSGWESLQHIIAPHNYMPLGLNHID
jgi:hypothetical protein